MEYALTLKTKASIFPFVSYISTISKDFTIDFYCLLQALEILRILAVVFIFMFTLFIKRWTKLYNMSWKWNSMLIWYTRQLLYTEENKCTSVTLHPHPVSYSPNRNKNSLVIKVLQNLGVVFHNRFDQIQGNTVEIIVKTSLIET